MISTAMSITARVAITGFLTVSCFKRTIVDNTVQVLYKSEKVSAGLFAYSVCLSTITLVLAADAAAQRLLSNDSNHLPAPKDSDSGSNPPFANANTSATPTSKPVGLHYLQPPPSPPPSRLIESQPSPAPSSSRLIELQPYPFPSPPPLIESHPSPSQSPSSSHVIESTEIILSAPITCCTCMSCIILASSNLYSKRLSIDSNITLLPYDDDFNTDILSDDASDTDDCESFDDESTVYDSEDDRSEPQPLDILISLMNTLTLDDPPRPSKLRPLILVTNRNTITIIPYPPLPEPAYPVGASTRRIQARPLSDSRPSDPGVSLPGCPIDAFTRSMEAALSLTARLPPQS
ncbi:hypothetical protein DEU56DRAFT_982487 [Suillus clintonianus]|uniref:uncharacterized protein n=1 Tax=Suillus clintonianus TaxID=1904413 RepID=UPI001B87B63B|nr:uncharacterized protein DEU56DRAFT_982487 [Suillus clintonianus]KAG2128698.1 hypothetical protein DEU56DRAFT_982487 [Suillus clintonianus]